MQLFEQSEPYLDLGGDVPDTATADHYTEQWGDKLGYVQFIRASPAIKHTMGLQLGWPRLFDRIRDLASRKPVYVYDAACGFGGVFDQLRRDPAPAHLHYVGADIRNGLDQLPIPESMSGRVRFVRWDVSNPLPVDDRFDFVICRAAIHHTQSPEKTFVSLASVLKDEGVIAISAYARKNPIREAVDETLRSAIGAMNNTDAYEASKDFTKLGRDLQCIQEKVTISENLPFLEIPAGTYAVQDLVYRFMVKCWFNPEFGETHSHIVNFDWYHPTYAYRYTMEQLSEWFTTAGLRIDRTQSLPAQHYLEGTKPARGALPQVA